jgi:hypothetical protein
MANNASLCRLQHQGWLNLNIIVQCLTISGQVGERGVRLRFVKLQSDYGIRKLTTYPAVVERSSALR